MGRKVIVIGAGLGGLAAASYCARNGYDVQVLEQHRVPGGVAATWKRGAYTIDGGIHYLMGYRPGHPLYHLYEELDIVPGVRLAPLPSYGSYLDEATGRALDVGSDLEALGQDLRSLFPRDGVLLEDLLEAVRQLDTSDATVWEFGRPPELAGRLGQVRQLWHMRHLARFFSGRFAKPVEEYAAGASDPFLRFVLENLFLPEVPVWFLLLLLKLLETGELGALPDGSQAFSRSIEAGLLRRGGRVSYGADVAGIIVKNGAAAGVRLKDGAEHQAEAVIAAIDTHQLHYELLGGRFLDAKTRERHESWPLFRPMLMMNFGLREDLPGRPALLFVRAAKALELPGGGASGLFMRSFNYSDTLAPTGGGLLQVEIETGWDYWHDLRLRDGGAYAEAKEQAADTVTEWLDGLIPGFADLVEVRDVATPYTLWRYTRNRQGAFEGWLPRPDVLTTVLPRTVPGLRNLYLAGQWVVPGGGVPPVLYSGRQAAEILCRRDGKNFRVR